MVETDRLRIVPLTYAQLVKYIQAGNRLEAELSLVKTGRIFSEEIKEMVETFTLPGMKNARDDNYLFFTFWLVIDHSINTIVAELGFKGAPNRRGEIEIGYGTMPAYKNRGYMTEAVSGMVRWATARTDVEVILAETDHRNAASIRVVQKNNFVQFDRLGEMLWWKRGVSLIPQPVARG